MVERVPISSSSCGKLLGIKLDQKLSFEAYVESLCKKASQKLNGLSRIASSLKSKIVIKQFWNDQNCY